MIAADHLGCRISGQLFHGPVPMGDHMVLVEDEGGDGAALDDLGQFPAALFHLTRIPRPLDIGLFFLRDVPEGLDGTDDTALGGPDGGGSKKKPLPAFAQFSEKDFRLVSPVDQVRFFPFVAVQLPDFLFAALIENDIGHGGPFFVPEGSPLVACADHLQG